jgi:hypothetical protein
MKQIISYIKQYFSEVNKPVLMLVTVFTAVIIFLNYRFDIDNEISNGQSFIAHFGARYLIFIAAFCFPYLLYRSIERKSYFKNKGFILLLVIAPAIFALKAGLNIPLQFSHNANWNNYWNHIFYWPLLVLITGSLLFICWKIFDKEQPFYGIRTKGINWKPYLLMLLIMLPLVAAASTQADFLAVYPKIKVITGVYHEEGVAWWHKLLFELSYGSDFITIELFFRGFLILAFSKWAGKDAILAMACFYCTIHFGKPFGECISSYFGGILLGIVVYNTRYIFGGLIVHLGIAWMMEIGGYIGNNFF